VKSVFGKPDRKHNADDGVICSEYPAWMMDGQINSLGEDIDTLERDLNSGFIPSEDVFGAKQALGDFKERFDDIVRSKPNYSVSEEKVLHDGLEQLNDDVADTLYSRYDQLKGKGSIARPQREADLNDMPCIEVSQAIIDACNLNHVKNGRVSRNQADKARKILCSYFGRDDASREAIRPENNASRKRPMVGYVNERLAKRHEEIFGKKEKFVPDEKSVDIKDRIKTIGDKFDSLKDNGATKPGVEIKQEVPVKKKKGGKFWKCEEDNCGYEGTTSQKGIHIAGHARKRKLALAAKE